MRVLAGTILMAVAVSFGAGQAAVQNGAVRNRVDCESLAGLTLPATAIGLPTSGATIASAELIPASPQAVAADRAVLAIPE